MADSNLVVYEKYTNNHSGKRTKPITRITPHCVVGQVTAWRLGEIFYPSSKQASCQYGIGYNGDIGQYVPEAYRSWCTSSNENDQKAITMEIASDNFYPYAMNDEAIEAFINLCVDICQRYGKTKVVWIEDKTKALAYEPKDNEIQFTVHRWYANKSCPGDWMFERLGKYADEINKRLNSEKEDVDYKTLYLEAEAKLKSIEEILCQKV